MNYRWRQVSANPNIVQCDTSKVYGRWLANPRRVEIICCPACNKPAKVDCRGIYYCSIACTKPKPIDYMTITPIVDRDDLSWWQKLKRGI